MSRDLWAPGVHSPISDPDDFRAFYCAGQATLRLADPYTTEPIRGCEHAAARVFGLAFPPRVVMPAPLPPDALAFFALFGSMPFPAASTLWFFTLLASLGVAVVATVRLSGGSPLAVAAAYALAGGLVSINEGQIVPLVTAALCVAAIAIARSRWSVTGGALGIATFEPHVALAALASACSERSMRRPIALVLVLLAVAAFAVGGPMRTIEYLARVLPLHSKSEIGFFAQQFSLTTTAWSLGAPSPAAVALGTLDYACMFVLGVVVARRLRKRLEERAFLVLVPPAFVLLGGTFIHLSQMEIALPLGFLAYAKIKHRRALLAFAIVGLAIPTQFLIIASPLRHTFYPPVSSVHRPYVPVPGEAAALAEVTEMGTDPVVRPALGAALVATLPKLPTWLALAALVWVCTAEAFAREVKTTASRSRPVRTFFSRIRLPPSFRS
jgi:hypothetical protein